MAGEREGLPVKVLVVGSGGREHALAWKLARSRRVERVYCAPGNAGMAGVAETVPLAVSDHAGLIGFAKREGIGLTVIGPDDALGAGIADDFAAAGLKVFGPGKEGARFEVSKAFAKDFMVRYGIPTARFGVFERASEAHAFCASLPLPVVVKADGLALGKGVVIARTRHEAAFAIHRMMVAGEFGAAGRRVVIEEFLEGRECSAHALVDGKNFLLFPPAQDHKQIFDGGRGPNTGGMGTCSPVPFAGEALWERVREEVLERFVAGLAAEGIAFRGMLFPGLMITADGVKVLEFNCRFGDPETQVFVRRLESDLVDLLEAAADGELAGARAEWSAEAAVCVVAASRGYPGAYEKGARIQGIGDAEAMEGVAVFHAGTAVREGEVVTSGGRVLGVTAVGGTLADARERAYAAMGRILFDGMQYRRDIGAGAEA